MIKKECIETLLDKRFIRVYDLRYAEGKHYYNASRRPEEDLICTKTDEAFKVMEADAATCFVILKEKGEEPKLLLSYEYRYPTGQFLLSPPAGLIDPEDRGKEDALLMTAKREILEETGVEVKETDRLFCVNPLVFSTPGMTDECNGLVCAVVEVEDLSGLSQKGAVGSEQFDGFELLSKQQVRSILQSGRDPKGNFYPVYSWCAMMYFISDLWK